MDIKTHFIFFYVQMCTKICTLHKIIDKKNQPRAPVAHLVERDLLCWAVTAAGLVWLQPGTFAACRPLPLPCLSCFSPAATIWMKQKCKKKKKRGSNTQIIYTKDNEFNVTKSNYKWHLECPCTRFWYPQMDWWILISKLQKQEVVNSNNFALQQVHLDIKLSKQSVLNSKRWSEALFEWKVSKLSLRQRDRLAITELKLLKGAEQRTVCRVKRVWQGLW